MNDEYIGSLDNEDYKGSLKDKPWVCGEYVNGTLEDSSGGFGSVFIGRPKDRLSNTKPCVLKIMNKYNMKKDDFIREVEVMKYIKDNILHANHKALECTSLLHIYDGWIENSITNIKGETHVSSMLAVEHLKGGDLVNFLNRGLTLSEDQLRRLLKPVFDALNILHDHKIVHNDIKIDNLVFRDIENKELVLCDFGLAYQLRWPGERDIVKPLFSKSLLSIYLFNYLSLYLTTYLIIYRSISLSKVEK
jgi:serine/threonine protein kinase